MRTAVVLPVKRFAQAKQRLGARVADRLRRDLAQAMVGDVLEAIAGVHAIDLTVLVSREPAVVSGARRQGALIVQDAERGQSEAVRLGIQAALRHGARRVLCIPGDCPALDPLEVAALLQDPAEEDEAAVLIVPDRHGTGTNGLLLTPPSAISPSFGPGSCARHVALAREAGVRCRVAYTSSLLLDVDTGEDLAALGKRLAEEHVWAPRTRALLQTSEQRVWEASHSAA